MAWQKPSIQAWHQESCQGEVNMRFALTVHGGGADVDWWAAVQGILSNTPVEVFIQNNISIF